MGGRIVVDMEGGLLEGMRAPASERLSGTALQASTGRPYEGYETG